MLNSGVPETGGTELSFENSCSGFVLGSNRKALQIFRLVTICYRCVHLCTGKSKGGRGEADDMII